MDENSQIEKLLIEQKQEIGKLVQKTSNLEAAIRKLQKMLTLFCSPDTPIAGIMDSSVDAYRNVIRENISYYTLICDGVSKERLDELVEIMVETIAVPRQFVTISGVEYPYDMVKARLMKVNMEHIQYVLYCLDHNTTKIKKIRPYLLACIYNAPSTIHSYYVAEVSHNMAASKPKNKG